MGYKVLAPCTVRSADSKSAVHYRQVGDIVEVPHKADADLLVQGRFLEQVKDEPESEPEKSAPTPKAKPGV